MGPQICPAAAKALSKQQSLLANLQSSAKFPLFNLVVCAGVPSFRTSDATLAVEQLSQYVRFSFVYLFMPFAAQSSQFSPPQVIALCLPLSIFFTFKLI